MKAKLTLLLVLLIGCVTNTIQKPAFIPPQPTFLYDRIRPMPGGNGTQDRFAVIIGANTEYRHQGNISMAYQVLIEEGYKRDDVFILDTASSSPHFPKTDTTSTLAVNELFKYLASVVEPHDTLLVYITGHGVRANERSFIMLNQSEKMDAREFTELLVRIKPATGFLFVDHCYIGPSVAPQECNWITMTVATSTTTSSGTSFPRSFWSAIREGSKTIKDAFDAAQKRDTSTRSGQNRPNLLVGSCVNSTTSIVLY